MAAADAAEIRVLAAILDELDYYQILEVERNAPGSTVRQAYHAASRKFHPDAHRRLDALARSAVDRIAKRVTEAYSVLRDPKRRRAYDRRLDAEGAARMRLSDAVEADRRIFRERTGTTPNGQRFSAMAHAEIDRGNLDAAARHLQTALTFEPGNAFFKQKLAELRNHRR